MGNSSTIDSPPLPPPRDDEGHIDIKPNLPSHLLVIATHESDAIYNGGSFLDCFAVKVKDLPIKLQNPKEWVQLEDSFPNDDVRKLFDPFFDNAETVANIAYFQWFHNFNVAVVMIED